HRSSKLRDRWKCHTRPTATRSTRTTSMGNSAEESIAVPLAIDPPAHMIIPRVSGRRTVAAASRHDPAEAAVARNVIEQWGSAPIASVGKGGRAGRLDGRERLEDLVRVRGAFGYDPGVPGLQQDHLALDVQLGPAVDDVA